MQKLKRQQKTSLNDNKVWLNSEMQPDSGIVNNNPFLFSLSCQF